MRRFRKLKPRTSTLQSWPLT